MAKTSTLQGEERRHAILDRVNRDGSAGLDQLAAELHVSSMTVRRDLDDLEADGLLRRVRGGAVALNGPRQFGERRAVRTRAKQVIASKASAFLPSSGAIALDASSTVGTLAATLGSRPGLVVATNSYENFTAASAGGHARAVLIGGELDDATGSFVGKVACDAASSMLYQRFFTSAAAVDPRQGSSEASLAESQVKRAFAERSQRVVLCVDSSKLGGVAISAAFRLNEVEALITELRPEDTRLDAYRDATDLR